VVAGITQDAPAGQTVRVRLLGQFAITAGDRAVGPWPRPSARRLCALLLVSPGCRVSRDLACEELFPRLAPRAAARSLSKALSMARAALAELGEPGGALLGADLTHLWLAPGIAVDADDLTAALHAGLAMPPGQARDDGLSAALADDGELLPGEPYADWADRARDRLNSLRQEARLTLARDRAKGAGGSGPGDVAAAWLACLDHDPACEEAAGALIRGHLVRGRPEQAARVFERCRAALEELGLRISPSLERVYASAVTQGQASPAPPPSAASVSSVTHGPSVPSARPASPGAAPSAASMSSASARAPREERRPVTVLFAEVAAPAGLAGTLGLEALRDVVGGSLAAVIAEVEALGGTVSSVSGRGLQAMFGAPEAHEDDPERALRAAYRALAATAALRTPASTRAASPITASAVTASAVTASAVTASAVTASTGAGSGLGLRIGVESGPALVGPIGGGAKVEYAALGDVVSVAAALQSAARPGSVLVGPATRAVTAHLFTWGAHEEVALAADARPLIAGYLDAPRATAAERRPRLGGRAPLVGRQAELRLLDTALRAAVDGRGQFVVLTGEPGLGKTRLVQESRKRFIAWVGAGTGRRPLWLEGRGVSYASATPYGLYSQLLASWLDVALDQPAATLRSALADALTRLMGNTNLLTPLAHLMGLPHPGAQPETQPHLVAPGPSAGRARGRIAPGELQQQVFAAMRALVSRFAAVGPAVLVLEDLHWADPTSLRLTAELAELTAGRPLLLLATSRPGTGPADVAPSAPTAREIRLRPLGADAAEAFARSLIGQVGGPGVLAAVLANADGNPLFLEERLAEMLEAGILVREQGGWRLREPDDPAQPQVLVPQVLERLVRSRVDRLSPAAADAIRAAAVLGTEFTVDVLAATMGTRPAALAPVLAEMCASDLVHNEPPESSSSVFRFRHALIQEATYLALLRAERRDLHARAARALEAAACGRLPEIAAVLGRHYASAENAERAVHYLELAGDHATDAFANDEAISSFREALAVTQQTASVRSVGSGPAADMRTAAVWLYAKLANVLWRTARRDEARAAFHAALRLASAGPRPLDPLSRAHLHTRLGRLDMMELRYAEATAAFDAAEVLLGGDLCCDPGFGDDATADQWLELMIDGRADLHLMRLEPDRALAVLERARPVLEARGAPVRKTAFYRIATMQKLVRNRLRVDDEDIASLRASVAAAERTGEDKDLGYATDFLGWALWLRGDLTEAAAELTKALALGERIGETHLRDVALLCLSLTALRRHDVAAVRTLLPQAFAAAEEASGRIGSRSPGGLACAAWLAWQDGRPDEVIRLAAEIENSGLSVMSFGAMYRWVYLFPLLAARLRSGETEEAVTVARRVIDPSQQMLPDDLTTALAVACQSWDQGNRAETADRLTEALALARALAYF
jgi:class 3 adenylate cyclase/tetratricopeptide (TPR) repeat protein